MTFEEAFNTGYRFKLPDNYNGYKNTWHNWWWVKEGDLVKVIGTDALYDKDEIFNNDMSEGPEAYKVSTEWILHPDDIRTIHDNAYNEKVLEIINE